jgi:serine palmitoyltransferase
LQVLEVVDELGDLLNVKYFPLKKSGRAILYNKEGFDNEASFEEMHSEPEA